MLAAAGLSCSSPSGQLTLLPHPDGVCAGWWRRGTAWEQDVKPRKQNSKKKKRLAPSNSHIPLLQSLARSRGPSADPAAAGRAVGCRAAGSEPSQPQPWVLAVAPSAEQKKKGKYWAKREITKPKENTSLFQFLFAKQEITERCLTWLPCSILFGCSKQRGRSWEGGRGSRHTSFARRSGGTAGQSWAAGIPVIPVSPERGLGWQNEPPALHWTELETAQHEQCHAASTSSCGDVRPSCASSSLLQRVPGAVLT